jgi:hypothetical protein
MRWRSWALGSTAASTDRYDPATMWRLIVLGLVYAIGFGFFRRVGGLGAAGEALRSWGRAAHRHEGDEESRQR